MLKQTVIKRSRSVWMQEMESKSPGRYQFCVLALAALLMVAHHVFDELAYHPEHSLWTVGVFWKGLWKYVAMPFVMWLAWKLIAGERLKTSRAIVGMGLILCVGSVLAFCVPNILHSIESMHLYRFKISTEKWHWATFRFYWSYWTPLVLIGGNLILYRRWRKGVGKSSVAEAKVSTTARTGTGSPILKSLAVLTATAACVVTALHLAVPRLPANADVVDLTRSYLVAERQKGDFDFLVQNSFSPGDKLKPLLTHLELADLQRNKFYPSIDDNTYRQYILSPAIARLPLPEINWRRTLWENFYPRIRRENDPIVAAQIVVRFLRERVGIDPNFNYRVGVETIWAEQMTDRSGFERIYVAALRSVGIAARLDSSGKAELLENDQWQPAPQVLVYSFEDEKFPVPKGGLINFR